MQTAWQDGPETSHGVRKGHGFGGTRPLGNLALYSANQTSAVGDPVCAWQHEVLGPAGSAILDHLPRQGMGGGEPGVAGRGDDTTGVAPLCLRLVFCWYEFSVELLKCYR
jgi:hypothetical protein